MWRIMVKDEGGRSWSVNANACSCRHAKVTLCWWVMRKFVAITLACCFVAGVSTTVPVAIFDRVLVQMLSVRSFSVTS